MLGFELPNALLEPTVTTSALPFDGAPEQAGPAATSRPRGSRQRRPSRRLHIGSLTARACGFGTTTRFS